MQHIHICFPMHQLSTAGCAVKQPCPLHDPACQLLPESSANMFTFLCCSALPDLLPASPTGHQVSGWQDEPAALHRTSAECEAATSCYLGRGGAPCHGDGHQDHPSGISTPGSIVCFAAVHWGRATCREPKAAHQHQSSLQIKAAQTLAGCQSASCVHATATARPQAAFCLRRGPCSSAGWQHQ